MATTRRKQPKHTLLDEHARVGFRVFGDPLDPEDVNAMP